MRVFTHSLTQKRKKMLSSSSSAYTRTTTWPTIDIGAGDADITSDRLSEVFRHPDSSDILAMFIPFQEMWVNSAHTWDDVNGSTSSKRPVQLYRQLIEIFMFWAQIIKDAQVEILENGHSLPALIPLICDVPSRIPGDPIVGIGLFWILQGVKHKFRPNAETGMESDGEDSNNSTSNNSMNDDEAMECDEPEQDPEPEEGFVEPEEEEQDEYEDGDPGRKRKPKTKTKAKNKKKKKKEKTPKQIAAEIKRKEKLKMEELKKILSRPSVYRAWYDWLRNNEMIESERLMASMSTTDSKGMGKFNKNHQQQTTTLYNGITLRKWRTLCEFYSGRDIDIDEVARTFKDPLSARAGELGSVSPPEVFTIYKFTQLCAHYKADLAFCSMANYPSQERGEVELPVAADGKTHFYRMSHEDLKPGNSGHTIWNQHFPHFPPPDMSDRPEVKAFNARHGRPDGEVSDAARRGFLQQTESNLYTADEELAKKLRTRFNRLHEECKGDLTKLKEGRRRIQLDALNTMHSYRQRKNKLPLADMGIMDWGDAYLIKTGGYMHWTLPMLSRNLTWLSNKIEIINASCDHMFAINNLHKEFMIVNASCFLVNLFREMQFNIAIGGGPGTGKSWLFKLFHKLLIQATTNMISGSSEKYDTDGTNTLSNSVEINEEAQGSKVGASVNGSVNSKTSGASDRQSTTKSKQTSGKVTTARLTKDPETGEFVTKMYVTQCNNATLSAMNGCLYLTLPDAIQDRNLIMMFTDRVPDEYRGLRSMTTSDTSEFKDFMSDVGDRFRHNQFCFARVAWILNNETIEAADQSVTDLLYRKVAAIYKAKGGVVAKRLTTRFQERYKLLVDYFTILEAVSIVFESPISDEMGKKFTDESPLKVEPYLVAHQDIGIFVWGLMMDAIEPEVDRQVLTYLRDHYFGGITNISAMDVFGDEEPPPALSRTESDIPDIHVGSTTTTPSTSASGLRKAMAKAASAGLPPKHPNTPTPTPTNTSTSTSTSSSHQTRVEIQSGYISHSTDPSNKDQKSDIVDDGFYVKRRYDNAQTQRTPSDREVDVATSIAQRMGNVSIEADDVRAVLKALAEHKIEVPEREFTQKDGTRVRVVRCLKPALVWGPTDIHVATRVLEGIDTHTSHGDKMLANLKKCICPLQVDPNYDTLVGWMDNRHTTRFKTVKFPSSSDTPEDNVLPKPKFACPASQQALLAMATHDGQAPRNLQGVFDADPVINMDSNYYTSRVQDRMLKLGLTNEDFKDKPHPDRRIYNQQLRDYLNTQELPVYPDKYLDMGKIVTDMRELLDKKSKITKEEFVDRVRKLPVVSPAIDEARLDILRLHESHSVQELRGRLGLVVSLKEHALKTMSALDAHVNELQALNA